MNHLPHKIAAAVSAISLALAMSGVVAGQAGAAGDCGLITAREVGAILHLHHIYESNPLLFGAPPTGSSESDCHIVAWSGRKPATATREAAKRANGTLASLDITTWSPSADLLAPSWDASGFTAKLTALNLEAQNLLVTKLHGKAFAPPPLHASATGYVAVTGHARLAVAFWSSPSLHEILSLSLTEARTRSAVVHMRKLASTVVPAFGL